MKRSGNRDARGFTLMEVMISLAILGMSLGVLLTSQASSLDNASRSRDLTIATLLARGKMIDLEQELFDEGFTEGDQTDSDAFTEEGHPEIKWESKISEIQLDLSGMMDMCGGFGDEGGDDADCEGMLGGMGGMLDGFMEDLGRSLRLVELTVTWPVGDKYTENMVVRAVVSREDFNFEAAGLLPGAGNPNARGSTGGARTGGNSNNLNSRRVK